MGSLEHVNSQRQKVEEKLPESRVREKQKWFVPGYRVGDNENNVVDNEKVLGINTGDAYTALWMFLMPLNCTLTND